MDNGQADSCNLIRELQLKELEILKEFIKVCEKYDLKYYAVGGTLIGAVRHKGFIPWDDDMDLAMPRKDYDIFIKKCYKDLPSHIKPNDFHFSEEDVYFYPLKLMNTDVKVTEDRLADTGKDSYLSIDIFPIDSIPDSRLERKLYKAEFYKYKFLTALCNIDILRKNVERPFYEKVVIKAAKLLNTGKHLKLKNIQYGFDRFLKKHSRKGGRLVGDITGAYGFREFVPRRYFGNGASLDFEGIKIRVPSDYDAYLTHIYGDYMTLPPESDRKAGHLKTVEDEKKKEKRRQIGEQK